VSEIRSALVDFASKKPMMAKAALVRLPQIAAATQRVAPVHGVVLAYKPSKKAVQAKAALKTMGRPRQQPIAAAR
jgi:hypothetical protein